MIKAEQLGHTYGLTRALVDVSFEIQKGTIVGLVGPNGAGKTTTMKILTGFFVPESGRALIAGHDIVTERLAAQAHIGYLPENAPLYRDMSVQEYLLYVAKLRSVAATDRLQRLANVVDACDLADVLAKPIGHLSKGFRQRVGLAQAMIHDPDILILDEPTSGLDPNQILEIRSLVHALGQRKTVVLSTHILSEVEAMCSRAIMIVGGRVHADEQLTGASAVRAALVGIEGAPADAASRLGALAGVTAVEVQGKTGTVSRFRVVGGSGQSLMEAVGRCASAAQWTLVELTAERRDLEDVFKAIRRNTGAA